MADFYRTNASDPASFIRGAARLLWAGTTIAFPTKIADVINLSLFDPTAGWNEMGATKTGIQISVNSTDENFDVDQITGDIDARPTGWDYAVGTALAEFSVQKMQLAWEGSAVTLDAVAQENQVGFGTPVIYTKRRLACLFPRSDGKLRGYFFRIVQRTPQESSVTFAKTGEQITIPVRWKALPDLSISDVYSRVFIVRDQV